MDANNPASQPCGNVEKSPAGRHDWIRRADGTAECSHCHVQLNAAQASKLQADEGGSVSRKAASATGKADKGAATP